MIHFICPPVLTNLLEQSRVQMIGKQSSVDVVVISDYYPPISPKIHSGLLEALKYRLAHPSSYIFITSFFSKIELLQYDTFGIINLEGTGFIRLPFFPEQIFNTIEASTKKELIIPKIDWEVFAVNACKTLLKEKITVLKHGNKLDFVNKVTVGVMAAALGSVSQPELLREYLPIIREKLAEIKNYNSIDEIVEIILLSNISSSLSDPFLQLVWQFTNGLHLLEMVATQEEINIKKLISDVAILNETLSKIQNQ